METQRNEITVKINATMEEIHKIIKEKEYEEIDKFSLNDTYFIPENLDIEKISTREILAKALIIRRIKRDEKIIKQITFKIKNIDSKGNILSQKSINCEIKSIEDAKKLLQAIGYREIMNIKENDTEYRKNGFQLAIKDIINGDKLVRSRPDNYEIMGIEGVVAKVYFNRLFKEFEWNGRQPRVKRDKINLLMDIGYTILFNYIEAILNIYGFDVYKGNLHKEFYKRKSLVCDIIEPFRPIIDYKIRKCMKLRQLDNYKYTIDNGQYHIDWKDGMNFMLLMLEGINEYKREIFKYIQQYYRWTMKEKGIEEFPKVVLLNDSDKL